MIASDQFALCASVGWCGPRGPCCELHVRAAGARDESPRAESKFSKHPVDTLLQLCYTSVHIETHCVNVAQETPAA